MKKIERFVVWESSDEAKHCNHQAVISQKKCMVNIADLNELERQRGEAVGALQDICKMIDERLTCYGTMGVLIDVVNIAQKALKEIKEGKR